MKTLPALTVLALVGLALAGCSTGTTTSAASGAAASGNPGGTSASAPSAATAADAVDVCDAVPLEKITAITGRSGYLKTNGGTAGESGADVSVCQYFDTDDASTTYQLTLAIYRNGDPAKIFSDRAALLTSLAPISGYGDRAQGGDGELEVVYGSQVITVTDALHAEGDTTLGTTQLSQIVDALHAEL